MCRYYILPDSLNLDTLLVDLDQPKIRPKRPERPAGRREGSLGLMMVMQGPCTPVQAVCMCLQEAWEEHLLPTPPWLCWGLSQASSTLLGSQAAPCPHIMQAASPAMDDPKPVTYRIRLH